MQERGSFENVKSVLKEGVHCIPEIGVAHDQWCPSW
jgi:hypothetical protein